MPTVCCFRLRYTRRERMRYRPRRRSRRGAFVSWGAPSSHCESGPTGYLSVAIPHGGIGEKVFDGCGQTKLDRTVKYRTQIGVGRTNDRSQWARASKCLGDQVRQWLAAGCADSAGENDDLRVEYCCHSGDPDGETLCQCSQIAIATRTDRLAHCRVSGAGTDARVLRQRQHCRTPDQLLQIACGAVRPSTGM
jgi:hypothetical protein